MNFAAGSSFFSSWTKEGEYSMVSWKRNSSVRAEQCSQLGFWPPGKGTRRQAGMPGSWVEQHYATFFMTIWFKQWFYKAIIAFMIFYDFELLVLNLLFYYFLKSVSCLFWADGKSLMQSEDSWAGVDDHRWESLGQIQLEDMLRWTLKCYGWHRLQVLRDLWFIWLTTCCFNILFCVFGQCSSLCLLARLQILTQLELQLVLEQCHRCPFLLQTGAIGVGDVYVFLVVCFLHCAACGRRRMSPSARHKQGLVRQDRNPGFRSGNLYFL